MPFEDIVFNTFDIEEGSGTVKTVPGLVLGGNIGREECKRQALIMADALDLEIWTWLDNDFFDKDAAYVNYMYYVLLPKPIAASIRNGYGKLVTHNSMEEQTNVAIG